MVCMDVVPTLDDREYAVIVHALGLTRRGGRGRFGRRWAYRNVFAAGETDAPIWRNLEAKGFARQICGTGTLRPFHTFEVTWHGMSAADVLAYVPRDIQECA